MTTAAIPVGAQVRSHDFPDNRDMQCYVEGTVEAILDVGDTFTFTDDLGRTLYPQFHDCGRYVIKVSVKARDGVRTAITDTRYVFPPLNGTRSWLGGFTNGVEVIA